MIVQSEPVDCALAVKVVTGLVLACGNGGPPESSLNNKVVEV